MEKMDFLSPQRKHFLWFSDEKLLINILCKKKKLAPHLLKQVHRKSKLTYIHKFIYIYGFRYLGQKCTTAAVTATC